MISRSIHLIRAVRSALILLIILSFPMTGFPQAPAAGTAPAAQPAATPASAGTSSVPAATPVSAGTASVSAEIPAPAAPSAPGEEPGKYTIREGDTLWDISNALYRDPFLWPLIWKSNPSVTDPDLIYPGNVLVIPSLAPVERAMSAPEEAAPVQESAAAVPAAEPQPEEPARLSIFQRREVTEGAAPEQPAAGSTLIVPEAAPLPLIDKYAMLSAGFVSEEDSKDVIQGSPEDPSRGTDHPVLLGYDHEVFITVRSRETVNIGDRFIIYEPVHDVRHPDTGRHYGKLYKVNGILKVTGAKEKGVYRARITLSFDESTKGDMLAPYQEPTPLFPATQKQMKNVSGMLLEVTDTRSISGQFNFVYLDKGKEDGVEPGDTFTVFGRPNRETKLEQTIGEVQVFIVKARTATAVIRRSTDSLEIGNKFVFKN